MLIIQPTNFTLDLVVSKISLAFGFYIDNLIVLFSSYYVAPLAAECLSAAVLQGLSLSHSDVHPVH